MLSQNLKMPIILFLLFTLPSSNKSQTELLLNVLCSPTIHRKTPKNRISVLSDMVQSAVKSCIANVFFY